jgi:outer membrane protein TolC
MKSIKLIPIVLILLVGSIFDSAGAELHLSKSDAVDIAIRNSEIVAIADEDVAKAEGMITEARAGALPNLSASGSYMRNIKSPVLFFGMGDSVTQITIGSDNEYQFDLTLTQVLFSGGRVGKALKIAKLYKTSSVDERRASESDAAFHAVQAYLDVLLAEKLLRVSRASLEQAEEHLRNTELFFKQGTASEFELLTAEVAVANAKPQVIQAEGGYELARDNLMRVLGLDLSTDFTLTDTLSYESVELDLQELISYGLSNRPDLEAAALRTEIAGLAVGVAKGGRLPSVGLFGRWSHSASTDQTFPDSEEWARSLSVGVEVSVPLFDGLRTKGQISQAKADRETARYYYESLARFAEMEIKQAFTEFESSLEKITAQKTTLGQAKRALELAEIRYSNGISTQLDVKDARLMLSMARTNYFEAVHSYNVSIAAIKKVIGAPVGASLNDVLPAGGR